MGVWDYIDPKGEKDLERPEKPPPHPDLEGLIERLLPVNLGPPSSTDSPSLEKVETGSMEAQRCSACGSQTGTSQGYPNPRQPLSAAEKDNLKFYLDIMRQRQNSEYNDARQTFNDRQKDIRTMTSRVRSSVAPHYIGFVDREPTLRGKLKALSSQAKLPDRMERKYATEAFEKLLSVDLERADLQIWTVQVTDAYLHCKEVNAALDMISMWQILDALRDKFPIDVFDWMRELNQGKELDVVDIMESIRRRQHSPF